MAEPLYLTASEAAAELGVGRATLYAYVSRGMIRSEPLGEGRRRRYWAEDVRALLDRRSRRQDPEAIAGAALDFGTPVLESAITLIDGGGLYYRGRDAVRLAQHASLEAVATLLWQDDGDNPFAASGDMPDIVQSLCPAIEALGPIERCMTVLPTAASADLQAFAQQGHAVRRTGSRLVRLIAAAVVGVSPSARPIHQVLGRGWMVDDKAADLVRAALVLCADHELNASAFTVRCAASTGSNLYHVVAAGMAALAGPRHGGLTSRVEAMLKEFDHSDDVASGLAARVRRGDGLPGFGHPLYPDGDPRGRALLDLLAGDYPDHPALSRGMTAVEVARDLTGAAPNLDLALALLGRVLGLPSDAGIAIFAAGRSVGWIGHALEQYATRRLIRPRARYVGPPPGTAASGAI